MAVSPNNMAFLLNLTLPIVSFTIAMLYQRPDKSQKLAIFSVTFLNEESLAYNSLQVALNSGELIRQAIMTSDRFSKVTKTADCLIGETNYIQLYVKTLSSAL
jgi:hypothetical protein